MAAELINSSLASVVYYVSVAFGMRFREIPLNAVAFRGMVEPLQRYKGRKKGGG
jgi:hypothetical protein